MATVAPTSQATEPKRRTRVTRHEVLDPRMPDRSQSSLPILADQVKLVQQAAIRRDEIMLRAELIALAAEAMTLARQPLIFRSPLDRRQRIAVERGPTGRAGSS